MANLDRNAALAYVARGQERPKMRILLRRLKAARKLSERQVLKESRSRGGMFSLFDAFVESDAEALSAQSHVSSS